MRLTQPSRFDEDDGSEVEYSEDDGEEDSDAEEGDEETEGLFSISSAGLSLF